MATDASVVSAQISDVVPLHAQPQPHASTSRNPQLGPDPFFAYPPPSRAQIDEELPPYWEGEDVPLGQVLDRLARKGYGDLRGLVEKTLPSVPARQKPKHIVEYAKTTRQSVLKYLALLRWKASVDTVSTASAQPANGATSLPTPYSEDTSPELISKGKSKAEEAENARGKVADARRLQTFFQHQNAQHEAAIEHLRHVTKLVDTLRARNPDLVTAISLNAGKYNRLPADLTDSFIPRPPLTAASILTTIRRLNTHLLYRLRAVDYVPSELVVDRVADGRVYVSTTIWRAELTVVGFEADSRWWLTNVEWLWKEADGAGGTYGQQERQAILDMVNMEVLEPREAEDGQTDSPLVRVYNFIQHLSLTCQLETLFTQAMTLSQGKWRNQLAVEIDRKTKQLRLRYWLRPRPPAAPQTSAVGKRTAAPRGPLVGGVLTLVIAESTVPVKNAEWILRRIANGNVLPSDRTLHLEIAIKWQVGEAGAGSGLKAGDTMDSSILRLNPANLSINDILPAAAQAHAAHLTRALAAPVLISTRLTLFPLNPPSLQESDSDRPLVAVIPLPGSQRASLTVGLSAKTGLLGVEDTGLPEGLWGLEEVATKEGMSSVTARDRAMRARVASAFMAAGRRGVVDTIATLIAGIVQEDIEDLLRQLGLSPSRKLPQENLEDPSMPGAPVAAKPKTRGIVTYVGLPVSDLHLLAIRVDDSGVMYELLRLARASDTGRISLGERAPMDLGKLAARRGIVKQGTGASFNVDKRDLQDMFLYCNALVAQTIVEQQLKDRGIPYTHVFPPDTDKHPVIGMVPNVVVNARDLLKDGRATEVAESDVVIHIRDWWLGGTCSVDTVVQLVHTPQASAATSAGASPAVARASSSSAARAEGISFDQATSTVRFHSDAIGRCVPDFLGQWERIGKVVVVAGEVNQLGKTEQFKDIRMLSFDLRTATLEYAPGFIVSITYTPASDSYEASFSRSAIGATPAMSTPAREDEPNPHEQLAPVLSYRLNELTREGSRSETAGKRFIQLLRATLPLLVEVDALRVSNAWLHLVIRSATEFRLVWDHQGKRHAFDVPLNPSASHYLIADATLPRADGLVDFSCGHLAPVPRLEAVVSKGYQLARMLRVDTAPENVVQLAYKVDAGKSLVCDVGCVAEVLRGVVGEVAKGLA
ncbi:mediator complex subunit [Cryptotrichosporon argae]